MTLLGDLHRFGLGDYGILDSQREYIHGARPEKQWLSEASEPIRPA